ncbi:MAG TPA: SUMF1/EgtB/PvdO family nonheme iron enzyme [Planctomycetota bacterium]|nr:SUMF1/EgtB/PvdO family nonheme iron enzyme [Planctomycetota bacterium]
MHRMLNPTRWPALLPMSLVALAVGALTGCGEPAAPPAATANTVPAEPVLPPDPPGTPAGADAWTADRIAVGDGLVMLRAGGTGTVGLSQAEIDWIVAAYGWPEKAAANAHSVTLAPYYIAETELTNGQFAKFLEANPEYRTAQKDSKLVAHWKPAAEPATLEGAHAGSGPAAAIVRQPVVYVARADAEAFAAWLTLSEQAAHRLPGGWAYRLPTEEEWELAARGPDNTAASQQTATATTEPRRRFPWGAEFKAENAWFGESIAGQKLDATSYFPWARGVKAKNTVDGVLLPNVQEVKTAKYYAGRSPVGCWHMAGNVWEWTAANDGEKAIAKGGSWWSPAPQLLISQRLVVDPAKPMPDVGFRLVAAPVALVAPAAP